LANRDGRTRNIRDVISPDKETAGMGFRIEETFQVEAPLPLVWSYLIDPRQVVRCIPGAELTGNESERVFLGTVKVKVGPVTASYEGRAVLTEVDEGGRRVRMTGEGRESGGAGSAKLSMMSRLAALGDRRTEVRVEADVDVAGKVVQFGRGMIEQVSKQLFRQFAECVRVEVARRAIGSAAPATTAAKPVRALPLLLRSLWAMILSVFRRLARSRD
jgi:carbon monoxide dehydrogenase subunit G